MINPWWSVALTALGGLGWLLVTVERRRAGFTVGVAAQVLWVTYAVITGQWGFLGSAALFGAINVLGLYRLHRAAHNRPAGPGHSGTVAMQRADGERHLPHVPPRNGGA